MPFDLGDAAGRAGAHFTSGGMLDVWIIAASLVVPQRAFCFWTNLTTGLVPRSRQSGLGHRSLPCAAEGTTVLADYSRYLEGSRPPWPHRLGRVIDHVGLLLEGTSRELKASVGGFSRLQVASANGRANETRPVFVLQRWLGRFVDLDPDVLRPADHQSAPVDYYWFRRPWPLWWLQDSHRRRIRAHPAEPGRRIPSP